MTHVELEKPESGGLGFSVVGLKSENHGELGIFIQEIQPGSVAHWYVKGGSSDAGRAHLGRSGTLCVLPQ